MPAKPGRIDRIESLLAEAAPGVERIQPHRRAGTKWFPMWPVSAGMLIAVLVAGSAIVLAFFLEFPA